jgi:type VI secretion system secreted protein Hcp
VHAGEVGSERWFLKIDGVAGDSTDAGHKDEIDVEAWSWGGSHSGASGSGGGGGAGKVNLQDFHFVSRISRATPKLFLSCATGTHHKEATLSGVRNVGKGKDIDLLKYKLRDVTVSSFQHGDSLEGSPVDSFSLTFSRVDVSFFPQSASGKLEPPISAGYDLKSNKKV